MDNPIFVDNENIVLVHDKDIDYDYNKPNTSRAREATLKSPDTTEILQLRVKEDKLAALYELWVVTGNISIYLQ